jgi:hypothetical protein
VRTHGGRGGVLGLAVGLLTTLPASGMAERRLVVELDRSRFVSAAVLVDTERHGHVWEHRAGGARERDSGFRARALPWLGLARDEASRALLQEAADLDQDGVSDAALTALTRRGPAPSPPTSAPPGRFPEPPRQRQPWQPPAASLPKGLIEATATLFRQGFADPRGGEYRTVSITGEDIVGGTREETVHGWVFAAADGGRFVVCWSGLVYPAAVISAAADFHRDVAAAIAATPGAQRSRDRRARPNIAAGPSGWSAFEGSAASETAASRLKCCLLLRLGEVALARRMWSALDWAEGPARGRLYPELATDWVWYAFVRAVAAHARADDALALPAARDLARIRAAVAAELRRGGYQRHELLDREPEQLIDFGTDPAKLLEDQERRARERAVGYPPPAPGPAGRIAGLLRRLEDIAQVQLDSPGSPELEESAVVKALVAEGGAAVEPLIECIEMDHRLTRSFESFRIGARHRVVLPVRRVALEAVTRILGAPELRDTPPEAGDEAGWKSLAASLRSRRHPK